MTPTRARVVRTVVLGTLALTSLAACRRKPTPTPTPSGPTAEELARADSIAKANADRARADSIAARERAVRDSIAAANRTRDEALAAARAALTAPVYFDYDAAAIRDDSREQLEAKIPLLTANPGIRIRIAGHTDERGSDEYNLALGQRRAASVKAFLSERGVDAGRVEIVSFGKERPTCEGQDESCFSRNRRAEFELTAGGESLTVPR